MFSANASSPADTPGTALRPGTLSARAAVGWRFIPHAAGRTLEQVVVVTLTFGWPGPLPEGVVIDRRYLDALQRWVVLLVGIDPRTKYPRPIGVEFLIPLEFVAEDGYWAKVVSPWFRAYAACIEGECRRAIMGVYDDVADHEHHVAVADRGRAVSTRTFRIETLTGLYEALAQLSVASAADPKGNPPSYATLYAGWVEWWVDQPPSSDRTRHLEWLEEEIMDLTDAGVASAARLP